MKEFFLDVHGNGCKDKGDMYSNWSHETCKTNPQRFIFTIKNKYYLVTYHQCLSINNIDFQEEIIKTVLEKHNIYEKYQVNRSVSIDTDLKNFRKYNQTLRKYVEEVNYIYSNASKKKFAITTTVNYIDHICSNYEREENYEEAKAYLIKNEFEFLLPNLEELYWANNMGDYDYAERFETIEHLIRMINQEIKTLEENGK
jgi:hypothetical protein